MTFPMPFFSPTISAPPATDPYFANVVLLFGAEGTNGSTTFVDESPAAHSPFTVNGNAQIDTSMHAVTGSTSSLKLDNSGDSLTVPDSADWRLATSNSDPYTIEFFYAPHGNVGGGSWLLAQGDFGNWGWDIDHTQGAGATSAVSFNFSADGSTRQALNATGLTVALDTWHHVAVSHNASGKIRIHFDGTMVANSTPANSAIFNSTRILEIGSFLGTANANCWIDEIRITKGVCRYDTDSSISVPTAAFPRS